MTTIPSPSAPSAPSLPDDPSEGSWDFKPLTPEQNKSMRALLLSIQTSVVAHDYRSATSNEYRVVPHVMKALPELGEAAFLVLRAVPRLKPYYYTSGVVQESWLDWDKPQKHLGSRWMSKRQGALVKRLLADGCHPSFIFSQSIDLAELPSPKECGRRLCSLGSSGSVDAIRLLFNAFDAIPSAQAPFRAGVVEGLRELGLLIWANRETVANRSEAAAILDAAPLFERMAKKKALPQDLIATATACAAKASAARGRVEEAPAFEFTEIQLKRQEALKNLASNDDAEAVELLLGVCGLNSPEAFEAGFSSNAPMPGLRYWSSAYAHYRDYKCCSLFVAHGDNPWLLAGDGHWGQNAQGNPFLWLSLSSPSGKELADFSAFALAFCDAALRDAESRSPGSGRELCLKSFDAAKAHPLWKASSPAAAAVNAAAERALLGLLLEAPGEAPEPLPARPRSRL